MRRKGEIIGRFGGRNLLMFSAGCGAGSEKALDKKRGYLLRLLHAAEKLA
jgi:hypothetical protein